MGLEMKNALMLIAMISCNQKEPPRVPLADPCIPQSIGDRGEALIEFEAVKNNDTPVVGTIKGLGALQGSLLTVDFDPESINTEVPLRDQRLADVLFRVTNFPLAVLTANLSPDASGKQKISGQLTMAGQSVHFEGYGEITSVGGVTVLRSTSESAQLNLGLSSELVSNLYELMKLADVSDIGKVINLTGEIVLARECRS